MTCVVFLFQKLIKLVESQGEIHEIDKLKLHINEIETITSVLLKLSCRLLKVENDLSSITDNNLHSKVFPFFLLSFNL